MGFNIKPNLSRYVPHQLQKGWGIIDLSTGELVKLDVKYRIERYPHKSWAIEQCKKLNNKED
jgi:hypothetical protein